MFDISLMINKEPKNKVKKSPELIAKITGNLREDTSLMNPVIRMQFPESRYATANYLWIPAFARYYFIQDIVVLVNGIYQVTAHVDVLNTYADQILSNQAIIKRQENNWNLYLNDGSFTAYQNPMVLTKTFPKGFTGTDFVLAVAGS